MSFVRFAICLLACALVTTTVEAGVLRLAPSSQFVDSGAAFTLQLFFDEVDGDITKAGGLLNAGARILVDASQAPLVSVDTKILNPLFDLQTIYPDQGAFPGLPPSGFANLIGFSQSAVINDEVPATGGTILLAEFAMRITAPPGTTVEFFPSTLGFDPQPQFEGLFGADGTLFDASTTFETATVTINGVVPEPGSMLIWAGLLGAPILVRGRRRLRGSESNAR